MGRKPGSGRARWGRGPTARTWVTAAGALASWLAAASLAQGLWGADIERAVRQEGDRIEHFLERGTCPAQGPDQQAPARSHGDESFEPWELVSV